MCLLFLLILAKRSWSKMVKYRSRLYWWKLFVLGPALLHLQDSLRTVIAYYDNRTSKDCPNRHIKPIGKVIVALSNDGRLTDNDIAGSKRIVSSIKSAYPGTRILYLTQREDNTLHQFLTENDKILTTSNDVLSFSTIVLEELIQIPASIVKHFCNEPEVVFEDYATPQEDNVYEIHTEFIRRYSFNTEVRNNQINYYERLKFTIPLFLTLKNSLFMCKSRIRSLPLKRITILLFWLIVSRDISFCYSTVPAFQQGPIMKGNSPGKIIQ